MNKIDAFYENCHNIKEFANRYFDYLSTVIKSTDFAALEKIEAEFEEARRTRRTVFVVGNGGSATTASSMANDLGFDIVKKSQTDLP